MDNPQKKVLSAYQSKYLRHMAKMGGALLSKISKPSDDALNVIEIKTIREVSKAALFLTWEPMDRSAFHAGNENDKRRMLINSFITDENAYFESLAVMVKIFLLRLQVMSQIGMGIVDQSHILDLFSNVDDLRDMQEGVWLDIKQKVQRWEQLSTAGPGEVEEAISALAQSICKHASSFGVYSLYVSNFERAQKLFEILKESNEPFKQFIAVAEICEGAEFPILLSLPCIRYQQYLHVIDELIGTYSDRSKAAELNKAKKAIEQAIEEINDKKNDIDARMRVAFIQEKLFKGEVFLATPNRYFVKSGALKKLYNKTSFKLKNHQKYMFFLFNDVLIYALRPNATSDYYKFKHAVSLQGMTISEAHDSDRLSFGFQINSQGSSKSFAVYAADRKDRDDWMSAISQCLQRYPNEITKPVSADDLEEIISQGRKSLTRYATKVTESWIQINADSGVIYFYNLKTGIASLSLEDGAQVSSYNSFDHYEEPSTMGSTMGSKLCFQQGCGRKAVATLGDGKYCAVHSQDELEESEEKEDTAVEVAPPVSAIRPIPGVPPPPIAPRSIAPPPPGGSVPPVPPVPSMSSGSMRPPQSVIPPPSNSNDFAPPPPPPAAIPPPPTNLFASRAAPPPPMSAGIPPLPAAPTRTFAPPPSLTQASSLPIGFGPPRMAGAASGPPPFAMPGMARPIAKAPVVEDSDDIPPPPPPSRSGAFAPPPVSRSMTGGIPRAAGMPVVPPSFRPSLPDDNDDTPPPSPPSSVSRSRPAIAEQSSGAFVPPVLRSAAASRPSTTAVNNRPSVTAQVPLPARPKPVMTNRDGSDAPTVPKSASPQLATKPQAVLPPPPPPPANDEPKWKKVFSEQYKQHYYWCEETNEVTWTKPADYDGE
jgi:hypothetical protein